MRAAGAQLQNFNQGTPSFTALTEDTTAASSTFLDASSTVPLSAAMANTATVSTLWCAGAGASSIYGVYSSTKVTKNGVPAPTTSVFTATGAGSGSGPSAGSYRYTLVYRKASTQALSNALTATEASVTASGTESVTLAWTLSNNDTTKYDKIYVYRSSVSGVAGFTAGVLLAILNSSATGYTDDNTILTSAAVVPRENNLSLDNSELPSGTYKGVVLFKRRLATFSDSTLYISEINKFESWSSVNRITIPSGGPITGIGVISFSTPADATTEEILVAFKANEMWIVTGDGTITDSLPDWSLKFIDNTGAGNQAVIVSASNYIAWVGRQGVYMWAGADKPVLISRAIEDQFAFDGIIDLSKLDIAHGTYARKRNEIIWTLSHKEYGENVYGLKLDLRLTYPAISRAGGSRIADGVFTPDRHATAFYASAAFAPTSTTEERVYFGDDAGFVYKGYETGDDGGAGISFNYTSPFLDLGMPGKAKRLYKVVVWVERFGNWNLTLDYWADYRFLEAQKSSVSAPIAGSTNSSSLWDLGNWDTMLWDDYKPEVGAITFNINSNANNGEGDAFRFRFSQNGENQPVTILGYQVYYQQLATRK